MLRIVLDAGIVQLHDTATGHQLQVLRSDAAFTAGGDRNVRIEQHVAGGTTATARPVERRLALPAVRPQIRSD